MFPIKALPRFSATPRQASTHRHKQRLAKPLCGIAYPVKMITGNDGEQCSSNESGWTMYLGSPLSSDGDGEANDTEGSNVSTGCINGRSKNNYAYYDDGDYDSLASDASTGPAQVKSCNDKEKKSHKKNNNSRDEHGNGKDQKEKIHTKLPTNFDKKMGTTKKGEEKTTRRGHIKRRSSS